MILYGLFCIVFAWINRNIIRRHGKIKHGINGAIHLVWFAFIWYSLGEWAAIGSMFLGKVVFDTSLNLFRGLAIDYLSPEVRRYKGLRDAWKGGRIMDYLEYKVFKDMIPAKLFCLFVWFVLMNIR